LKDIDCYLRHNAVAKYIRANGYKKVIDIGGRGEGLSMYIPEMTVYELDSSPKARQRTNNCTLIHGDALNMNIPDGCFDAVVSLRTLEQIPTDKRTHFLRELKRIGGDVILQTYLDSEDGMFNASNNMAYYASKISKTMTKEEFIRNRIVRLEHIIEVYPDAIVIPLRNSDVWLDCLTKPFARLRYCLFWHHREYQPPYLDALIISKGVVGSGNPSSPEANKHQIVEDLWK